MIIDNKNNIYKNYILGFIISIILTIIPFFLVKYCFFINNKNLLTIILITCAVLQIFIHLIYFLHIDFSQNKIWNTAALIFTILVITILILGSVWIMEHLNHHHYGILP